MRTHNRFTKLWALVALAVSGVVIAAWSRAGVAAIGNPDIRPVEFGLLSLTPGQTARLTVVNPVLSAPPEPESQARRVRLAFDIYAIGDVENRPNPTSPDARLNTLRFLGRQSRVVALMPGEAASLDFTAAAGEAHISAVMLGGPDTSQGIGNPDIVPTLEVMEGGRTIYTHPAFVKGFNPQPDPPGAQ